VLVSNILPSYFDAKFTDNNKEGPKKPYKPFIKLGYLYTMYRNWYLGSNTLFRLTYHEAIFNDIGRDNLKSYIITNSLLLRHKTASTAE
jgi:hypothetical protein